MSGWQGTGPGKDTMSMHTPSWYLYLNRGGGHIHSQHKTTQKHTHIHTQINAYISKVCSLSKQ